MSEHIARISRVKISQNTLLIMKIFILRDSGRVGILSKRDAKLGGMVYPPDNLKAIIQ